MTIGKAWQQLHVAPGPPGTATMEQALVDAGAVSVTLLDAADQAILEPAPGTTPLWPTVRLVGLFRADVDLQAVLHAIEKRIGPLPATRIESLPEKDWEREWLVDFKPMRFGRSLWICPGGMLPDEDDAIVVQLDPGLAFGTGTHPTTALCLEWLDNYLQPDTRMLDFGSGSGVLSVAAMKLGARHVTAVDIDPQELQATRDNANRNGVGDRVCCCRPDQLESRHFDLVVANILAGTLIELRKDLAAMTEPGGALVLSGILGEQAGQVLACYSEDFEMDEPQILGEWARLSGRRAAT